MKPLDIMPLYYAHRRKRRLLLKSYGRNVRLRDDYVPLIITGCQVKCHFGKEVKAHRLQLWLTLEREPARTAAGGAGGQHKRAGGQQQLFGAPETEKGAGIKRRLGRPQFRGRPLARPCLILIFPTPRAESGPALFPSPLLCPKVTRVICQNGPLYQGARARHAKVTAVPASPEPFSRTVVHLPLASLGLLLLRR